MYLYVCPAVTLIVIDFLLLLMPMWTFSKGFCLSNRLLWHLSNMFSTTKIIKITWNIKVFQASCRSHLCLSYLLVSMVCIISTSLFMVFWSMSEDLDLHSWNIPEVIRMSTQQITVWWRSHMFLIPVDRDCPFRLPKVDPLAFLNNSLKRVQSGGIKHQTIAEVTVNV